MVTTKVKTGKGTYTTCTDCAKRIEALPQQWPEAIEAILAGCPTCGDGVDSGDGGEVGDTDWEAVIEQWMSLDLRETRLRFAQGDLLVRLRDRYGAGAIPQFARQVKSNVRFLQMLAKVSRSFPAAVRDGFTNPDGDFVLTWEHFRVALSANAKSPVEWLDRATERGWSSGTLHVELTETERAVEAKAKKDGGGKRGLKPMVEPDTGFAVGPADKDAGRDPSDARPTPRSSQAVSWDDATFAVLIEHDKAELAGWLIELIRKTRQKPRGLKGISLPPKPRG